MIDEGSISVPVPPELVVQSEVQWFIASINAQCLAVECHPFVSSATTEQIRELFPRFASVHIAEVRIPIVRWMVQF